MTGQELRDAIDRLPDKSSELLFLGHRYGRGFRVTHVATVAGTTLAVVLAEHGYREPPSTSTLIPFFAVSTTH